MHKLKNKCGNDSPLNLLKFIENIFIENTNYVSRLFPTLPVFNIDKFYLDSSRV